MTVTPDPPDPAYTTGDPDLTDSQARTAPLFADIADVSRRLAETGYLPDIATATAVFLADRLGKPLLVEGPAGVFVAGDLPSLHRAFAQDGGKLFPACLAGILSGGNNDDRGASVTGNGLRTVA